VLCRPLELRYVAHYSIRSDDVTGGHEDIRRVCKQVMNKTASKRIISKQEATVLLADLDLFASTETIESVSISNSTRVVVKDCTATKTKTFIQRYAQRPGTYDNMNLHDYFHHVKNHESQQNKKMILPNFVGVSGTPRFPVTVDYARHTLIVYRPWRTYPRDLDWLAEFELFINSKDCPMGPRITYERVMQRHYEKMTHYEAKATTVDHSGNPVDDDDMDLLFLAGMKANQEYDADDLLFQNMEKGIDYQWDTPPKVSNTTTENDGYSVTHNA
jgi:hypothetical protein